MGSAAIKDVALSTRYQKAIDKAYDDAVSKTFAIFITNHIEHVESAPQRFSEGIRLINEAYTHAKDLKE